MDDPNGNRNLVGHWNNDEASRYSVFLTVYQENFS